MADDRWDNDDEYGQRYGRQYGYGYDREQRWDRDQRGRRDEQHSDRNRQYGQSGYGQSGYGPPGDNRAFGDREYGERGYGERGSRPGGARSSEYSSIPGIGVNYGGGGWLDEYATDWRRHADRDYPSERNYERMYQSDYRQGRYSRDLPTRAYPGQRQDWLRGRDEGRHERGWWDRTKDEVRSWMGDAQAEQRRQADHSGRGPKGYTRSDERIREDVNDRLMEDWGVDATDIEVAVSAGEVTLSGTVDGRESKRRAENIAATVLGVQDVQNNLRVRKPAAYGSSTTETTGQATTTGQTSTSLGTSTPSGTTQPRH